jgi:hypothetical protein
MQLKPPTNPSFVVKIAKNPSFAVKTAIEE